MQATEVLAEEHRAITCVLTCLERLLRVTMREDLLDGEAAAEIVEFLEHAVDGIHQDKEELVLFPLLIRHASPEVRARLTHLLSEHEAERRELEFLRAQLEGAAYGDPLSRDSFTTRARAYARALGDHACWEDEHLLPLADELLGEREDAEVLAGFHAVERRHLVRGHRGPCEMLERIQARFGLTERPPRWPSPHGSPAPVAAG